MLADAIFMWHVPGLCPLFHLLSTNALATGPTSSTSRWLLATTMSSSYQKWAMPALSSAGWSFPKVGRPPALSRFNVSSPSFCLWLLSSRGFCWHHFFVAHLTEGESAREVYQYQYTNWPDHGMTQAVGNEEKSQAVVCCILPAGEDAL